MNPFEEKLAFYEYELAQKDKEIEAYHESGFMFLQAVSSNFICLAYVNLDSGMQTRFVKDNDEICSVSIDVSWDEYLVEIMSCICDEKLRKRLFSIARLNNIRKMKIGEKLEFDYYTTYQSDNGEPYYAHTLIMAVSKNNTPFVLVYTTQNDELEFAKLKAEEMLDQTKKLNKALDIENQYKESFLSGAEAVYYVNLTRDELEMAYYYDADRKATAIGKYVGLEIPCRYSDYVEAVMKRLPPKEATEFYYSSSGEMIESRIKNEQMYYCFDYQGKDKSGIPRWYRNSYLAAKNRETDELYCMITVQDITNTHELEEEYKRKLIKARDEAEVASRAKSNFLFNMSHDIRTPMNAILGFVGLAKNNQNNQEKVSEYLNKVEIAGKHLLNLINDVLSMARIESGKQELEIEPHTIRVHINELLEVVKTDADKKGIELIQKVDIVNEFIMCDSLRMYQIMMNILSNAIKYTPCGGTVVYDVKEIECKKPDYCRYRFSIKDNGIGMTEEFVEHVFDAFERDKNTTESGIEGTGLGLAITKQLVELMGGTIEVQSEQGIGSEFVVTLDFKIADRECVSKEEFADEWYRLKGRRILLVEDNELNREIAYECLTELGMVVETANNGKVAVDMIEGNEGFYYDAVLMDIQMPVLDGYGATRKIRRLNDIRKALVPIVAMTANAFDEDKETAIAMGMDEHIAKPFVIGKMLEVLYQVIFRR